jgi:hypothetical protein
VHATGTRRPPTCSCRLVNGLVAASDSAYMICLTACNTTTCETSSACYDEAATQSGCLHCRPSYTSRHVRLPSRCCCPLLVDGGQRSRTERQASEPWRGSGYCMAASGMTKRSDGKLRITGRRHLLSRRARFCLANRKIHISPVASVSTHRTSWYTTQGRRDTIHRIRVANAMVLLAAHPSVFSSSCKTSGDWQNAQPVHP